jgi:glycerophosphoryl diester phosphodiesterase
MLWTISLLLTLLLPSMQTPAFDWQGHRGARGLAPENTIPAFLHALQYPAITTLELDVVISRDSQVVVSHEPWLSHEICLYPDGKKIKKKEAAALNLFEMPYDHIRQYDCGMKGHPRFPHQEAMPAYKPTLRETVYAIQRYCRQQYRAMPAFNIELKARPSWDDRYTPAPEAFVRLVYAEIQELGIAQRATLQSFDPRILRELHRTDSSLTLSFLLEKSFQLEDVEKTLGFRPAIISPHHKLVSPLLVQQCRQRGMRVIPWTVNETARMKALRDMGVDGIITDYPNRIPD